MLKPADIENVEFKTTRLKEGYDQDEVDNFLDRVAADYKRLEELAAQTQQLPPVPTAPPPVVQPTEQAAKLLELAQKTADKAVADANAVSAQKIHEGRTEAHRLLGDATAEAERIRSEAHAEAERVKSEAATEGAQLLAAARAEAMEVREKATADAQFLMSEADKEAQATRTVAEQRARTLIAELVESVRKFEEAVEKDG